MKNRMAPNKWKQHFQQAKTKPVSTPIAEDVCLENVSYADQPVNNKKRRAYSEDAVDPGEKSEMSEDDCCRSNALTSPA